VTGNKSIVFKFADVVVREQEFCLVKAGEVLPVEPKTFRVLLYLLRNPQKLIAKEELLNAVWGDAVVTDSSLTRTIAQLRRLLGDEIRNPRYIETVATVGYRFLFPVEIFEDSSGNPYATGKENGLSKGDLVETPGIAEAATDPSEQSTREVITQGKDGRRTDGRRYRFKKWRLPGAALVAVGLTVAVWYLRRPLPPLKVTEYTRITHDGRGKQLAGTDGSRLYFMQNSAVGPIAQVAISGGEIAPIPTALPVFSLQDVSPDGSSLLVTTFDGSGHWGLWSVPIPAGSSRQLLTGVSVNSAAWSPDGKSVVYTTGNSDIDVIQSDGTGLRRVADVGGPSSTLSWSPDGSRIRFFKESRLWEMASDGSGLHELLPGWLPTTPLCCGRWTADGKFFVFLLQHPVRSGYQPGDQIWILGERRGLLRPAPTEPVQLTSGPVRWNTPIPSKDGTKIFAQGVILRGELVRFDAQSRQLQPWLGGISAEYVAFSPDGQFVTYVTFPLGVLWRANRDGSNPLQLTNPPTYPVAPHWSPDGAQILFSQEDSLGRLRSYIVSSQGGTPRQLVPEEKGGTGDASWSPDGRKIVFSSVKSMEAISSSNYDLRILDLGSRQITTLTGSHGTFSPRWSPNGRFMAGLHIGVPGGLAVFDFETQRWSVLPEKGEIDWPTWSSDSQFIFFVRPGDDPGVFRVRVSDGVEERVVDLKGFHHSGALGAWFGLDPQDTPMLLRDVGTADIYALTLDQK
jgi:Tol biopolymer transport system component/DNA-binding winged helix-turn-helix (wHTH) protein